MNNCNVLSFRSSPYVVCLPWLSLLKNPQQSIAVVYNIEPVANVLAVSVDGEWLLLYGIQDHQGNELFGKLIRSKII
jgi:hypothetical protein